MGKPHHRRGGFRGRRFGGNTYVDSGPDIIEETVFVVPADLDAIFVPPTDDPVFKVPQAGMTPFEFESDESFLDRPLHDARGPDENTTRATELDRAITALIRDMQQNMSANQDFLNLGQDVVALQIDWQAWHTDHLAYFQMVGTENDLNRFTNRYNLLRSRFQTVVGKTPNAPTLDIPPPSNPLGLPTLPDTTKLVAAVGVVAAIVIFGPTLMRSFSH